MSKDLRDRLKCDRGLPCKACATRGLSLSCTYAPNNVPERSNPSAVASASLSKMRDAVSDLERLIIRLGNAIGATDEIAAILGKVCSVVPDISCHRSDQRLQVAELKNYFDQHHDRGDHVPTAAETPNFDALDHVRHTEDASKASSPIPSNSPPSPDVNRHPNPFFSHLYVPATEEAAISHSIF